MSSFPDPAAVAQPRASAVLACASRPFFEQPLKLGGSCPVLLTTGLMAPEAYSVAAAVEAFVRDGDPETICKAAAQSYHRYQHCGLKAAEKLFTAP